MAQTLFEKAGDVFSLQNPLAHWWYQRLTAIALVPLSFWLLVFLFKALHAPYHDTVQWLMSPLNGFCLGTWIAAVVYHAALGVQVVLEDYVSTISVRHAAIRASNLLFLTLGIAAYTAIAIIWMG